MSNIAFSAVTSVSGTSNQITSSGGLNPVLTIASNPILPGSGSVVLPQGNTAARSGGAGAIRFNTQTSEFESTTDGVSWFPFSGASGSVVSVSGTANRITSTGGANPIIDIAATYVGQTSITTLGTITTGTWNATTIATTYGGTGLTSYILGDLIYGSGVNVLSKLAGNTTSGIQYLSQTGTGAVSAAPVWATISGGDITGAALTKVDDANVTLTLGGTPATALLRATSLTLGWTGQLSLARGGTNANLTASNGGIFYSTATAGAILAGTATARQMLQSGASSSPAWSTTTWPATSTINRILYSSSANVIGEITTANSAMLRTDSTGVPAWSASMTDGQIMIGATGGTPTPATLTAGSNITITNAANSITIASSGSGTGITWNNIAGTTQAAAVNNGYVVGNASQTTVTLPATAAIGDIVLVQGKGAGGWILTANGGQTIQLGSSATSAGGTLTSANQWDSIQVVCVTANTTWAVSYTLSAGLTVA